MPTKPKVEIIKPKPRSRQRPKPNKQTPALLAMETKFLLRSVSRMESEINRLWMTNKFIDIILVCDGKQFNCHRLVVAAASRLIESLLIENTSNNPTVIIPFGVRPPIMKLLIDFMYTGSAVVTEGGLQELVESAKLLQVTGLYDVTTRCLECFLDVRGVSHIVETKHTVLEHVLKIEHRMPFQKEVDPAGYPKQSDACDAPNQQNDELKRDDGCEIMDNDYGVVPISQGHSEQTVANCIEESRARIPSYDKTSNTTPIPYSKTKLFCEYNPIKKATNLSENVTIRRVPKSQPQQTVKDVHHGTQSTSKLITMFGQDQLSQELKSLQPSITTNAVKSNTASWTLTPSNQPSTSTQFVSTGVPIVASGIQQQQQPDHIQFLPNLLQEPESKFRVPIGRCPKVSNTISKSTPLKVPMSRCRNAPASIVRDWSTSRQIRAISQKMLRLNPRIILSRLRPKGAIEMPPSSKQANRTETEELISVGNSAHSSFLNLRVPPTRSRVLSSTTLPHIEDSKSLSEQEDSVFQGYAVNSGRGVELRKSLEQNREPSLSMDTDVVKSEPTSSVEECEIDGFSPADASFIRDSFPEFYAMLKKEKQDRIVAEKAREKKLGQQLLNEEEARAVVTIMSQDEIEKILCHPTLPYFDDDDDNDEDYKQEESKIIGIEKGMCIDYDRLVAETYSENEEELQQQREKRQESNLDEKTSFYYSPVNIPFSLPKFRKRKYPPTLLPLSVMHAKQFYYNHKLNTEENGDINFKEDPSIFGDADPKIRERDPRSPNSVVLRNPRCNQPRNYSTESLYNALMAVKYGESIYRSVSLPARISPT